MTSRTFFTADLHIGHVNIRDYCPARQVLGATLEEHNEALVSRWNETVGPDDNVYVIGDVVMGKRDDTLRYVAQLNGTKRLVSGNHDHCHPMHKRAEHWTERYMAAGFESVSTYEVLELASRQVLLCHFPYQGAGDHTDEERYPEWRPLDNGMPLLHGHIHDLWLDRGSMFNVGVDVHDYRPVPVERIVTWVRALETGAEGRVWTLTG